jgi:hypothetical protein
MEAGTDLRFVLVAFFWATCGLLGIATRRAITSLVEISSLSLGDLGMAKYDVARFEQITTEIGRLVISWTYLEFVLERLIWVLSDLKTYDECDAFLAHTDVREKVQIAKSFAVLRPIDERWKDKVIASLDKASNEYRNARNEMVHAQWFHSPNRGILRRRLKVRISKPQSFLPRQITTTEEIRPNIAAMKKLSRSITILSWDLELLHSYAGVWKINAEGSQAVSYAQFLRLVRSESRQRRGTKTRKRRQ